MLLTAHPDIAEAAVVGVPDTVMGERICAVIVPAPGAQITLEQLIAFLKEKSIAAYKLPEQMVVTDALPRNPLGKVLRRNLAEKIKD